MKTSELIGPALDWAVAEAKYKHGLDHNDPLLDHYHPTINWAQGGPIIEREKIDIVADPNGKDVWMGRNYVKGGTVKVFGPTPLIAAMRCYVVSKLGNEVDVPEELK